MSVTLENLRRKVIPYNLPINEYMETLLKEIKSSEMSLEEAEYRLVGYLEYNQQKSFI